MRYKIICASLMAGFFLDMLFGDPRRIPHPVVLTGKLIAFLEKKIRRLLPATPSGELWGGFFEVFAVCLVTFLIPTLVLKTAGRFGSGPVFILNALACGHLLAAKSLKDESMKVYDRLKHGTIEEARAAVSMIVGRDTQALDKAGVTRAAVETIAENTSDGVLAPMFYMALGGAPLMFLYKGINTMDSMLGYKNEKYLYFGRAAARLDDIANFIPARISGLLMVLSAFLMGEQYDGRNAFRIFKRDRKKHASPNSAQTESAMAGALRLRLAGNAFYFGRLHEKPYIGDDLRDIETEDIRRANHLMYGTAVAGLLLFSGMCAAAGILLP